MPDAFYGWIMDASAKSSFSFSISPYSKSFLVVEEMILWKHFLHSSDSFVSFGALILTSAGSQNKANQDFRLN